MRRIWSLAGFVKKLVWWSGVLNKISGKSSIEIRLCRDFNILRAGISLEIRMIRVAYGLL